MILRSVELTSFGKFRSQTVEFRRGMNLVIGPNEAGKSTVAEAVPAVLFGTDRLERFKPWGRNVCSAALFFEGNGHTVQVKRNLVTDEVELVEKDDLYHTRSQFSGKAPLRGRSASCREYRGLLEKLIGVADEKLFRATYFFGHHPQSWSGEDLAQKLRTLVSGTAETDYAEVLDTLLEEHFQLTRSNPWGRDKQRDREYEVVCQQLTEQGDEESVPIFVEIDNTADIEAEIQSLSGELEYDRQEHTKGLRYLERVRQQIDLTAEEALPVVDSPPVKKEQSTGEVTLSTQLAAVGLPHNPPRQLPEILAGASEIRQKLAGLQQPYSILNSREKKVPTVPWVTLVCLLGLLVTVCTGAWWQSFYLVTIMSVAGICSAVLLGWGSRRQMDRKSALADCRKERSRLDQKKIAAQQRQAELSERCNALGLPSSAIDLVRLQKLAATHRELLDLYWLDGDLPVTESEPVLEKDNAACEPMPVVVDAVVEDNEAEQELLQLEARMADFIAQLKVKEARLEELQMQFNQAPKVPVPRVKTSGTALLTRKHDLEERIAVLRKAINLLAEAVDEFSRSHLVRLNAEASKMFGKITGGRYAALKLDEDMTPSVQVDSRRWTPVDHLSRGTVDAIYLALRIALAKVRDDGRSLPLMLDDPFVHLDQKRLAKTLNLVDLASAGGQLILFSHNLDLGKRAARERWHVIPLDGDSEDTNSDEGGEHAGQLHLL